MSQIETIMLVALGFAIAALIALFLSRFFWVVALRLGNKRLLRSTPTTIAELRADRDRLRAEYAMLSRKLQLKMDNIKTKLAEQMAEVTRNRNRIDHLIVEVRTRDAMLAEKAGEIARLKAHLDPLEVELANRTQSVQSSKEQLRGRDVELARHHKAVEQLKTEISARDKRIEALRNEAMGKDLDYELATKDVQTAQERLQKRIEDLTSLSSQIETQRLHLAQQKTEFEWLQSELATAKVEPEPVEAKEPAPHWEFAAAPAQPEFLLPIQVADADLPLAAELPAVDELPAVPAGDQLEAAELPAVDADGDFAPRVEAAREDLPAPAEPPALVPENYFVDEPPAAAASAAGQSDVELRNLDTSLSARIAELKVGNDDQAVEASPKPPAPDAETDNASATPRGKLRSVTNVISLAARIRALQKTAGE